MTKTPSQPPPLEPLRTAGAPLATSPVPPEPTVVLRSEPRSYPKVSVALDAQGVEGVSLDAVKSIVAHWMDPIEGDSPVGVDVTYDARAERLFDLINHLESAESAKAGSPLWREVASESTMLLREVTKDLTVAAYLAHAMVKLEGHAGIARGLALLVALIDTYWPAMYPPASRVKRRANALAWYLDRTTAALGWQYAFSEDESALVAADALVRRLASQLRERLDEATPAFMPLREQIERLLVEARRVYP